MDELGFPLIGDFVDRNGAKIRESVKEMSICLKDIARLSRSASSAHEIERNAWSSLSGEARRIFVALTQELAVVYNNPPIYIANRDYLHVGHRMACEDGYRGVLFLPSLEIARFFKDKGCRFQVLPPEFQEVEVFPVGGVPVQPIGDDVLPCEHEELEGLIRSRGELTVDQIWHALEATDEGDFQIYGVFVRNVSLVGLLTEKTERETDVTFALNDGTGSINCQGNAALAKKMQPLSDGMYVKVFGNLEGFRRDRPLVVHSVRRVISYDEIANHFADSIPPPAMTLMHRI